jgi:hypothetical protein
MVISQMLFILANLKMTFIMAWDYFKLKMDHTTKENIKMD